MADNFDSNVARRKPNTQRKRRKSYPWDVVVAEGADTEAVDDGSREQTDPAPREFAI